MTVQKIPFQIDVSRVLELLAKQIYQSPLALLRENAQNAYDAVRLRQHLETLYNPTIVIDITPRTITISDNGVGMSPEDLRTHFWRGGSSSKNTPEARAAGVVGTFGIGAMANFGVADEVEVETESLKTGERTLSIARKATLSVHEDCIELHPLVATGAVGTRVTARLTGSLRVDEAIRYVKDFVSLLGVDVTANGTLISQKPVETIVAKPAAVHSLSEKSTNLGKRLRADVHLLVSSNADVWIALDAIRWGEVELVGRVALRSGLSAIQTYRSSFGLATVGLSSVYGFGGIVDLQVLEPTAGREAITTEGMELLQAIVNELDDYVSLKLAGFAECDSSQPFMAWAASRRRFDLCGHLRIQIAPGERTPLADIKTRSAGREVLLYGGNDTGLLNHYASDDLPVLILSKQKSRRLCELGFLQKYCKTSEIVDAPKVLSVVDSKVWTGPESAFVFRLQSVLDADYFVKASVRIGKLSHGVPILIEPASNSEPLTIILDSTAQALSLTLALYDTDYPGFGSMVKDFARTIIFPRIQAYVPSSTRQGAEAFLKTIRRPRELFEIAESDQSDLSTILVDYQKGRISMEEAIKRSSHVTKKSTQFVDRAASARMRDIVPDIVSNERTLRNAANGEVGDFDAAPAVVRSEVTSSAKLLTISAEEEPIRMFRGFLAITDAARQEFGEFFLQPHRTSVVWGGQRVLFVFMHHSGEFGLYYDLQTRHAIKARAGGGPVPTATIVLKNVTYIPIPDAVLADFVPMGAERKQFDVRCDLLRSDMPAAT